MFTDDTFDRLHDATRTLTRDAPIKERLLEAWSRHLCTLDPDTLPVDMREPYADEQRALHSMRPLPGETAMRATVRKMSCAEAARHAAFVTDLFAAFARSRAIGAPAQRRTTRAAPVQSAVVELFAAES